jgi:hypothetical protein
MKSSQKLRLNPMAKWILFLMQLVSLLILLLVLYMLLG